MTFDKKKWRQKNRDKERVSRKKYRKNKPEKVKESQKKYEKKNWEKIKVRLREYQKRDYVRAKAYIRYMTNYYYGKAEICLFCGSREKVEHHHSEPYDVHVFIDLCNKCHDKLHSEEDLK